MNPGSPHKGDQSVPIELQGSWLALNLIITNKKVYQIQVSICMKFSHEDRVQWRRRGLLILTLTIRHFVVIWVRLFLGRAFGKLKRCVGWLSLFGQQLGGGF